MIHSRLYKLEPFCYQLVDIPLKMHHPMWRENCDVDLTYHVRPWRLPAPGGRRELDEAIGEIASTPLDRSHPLWEMYFVEGLADNRIAVVGKVHHALADGVAAANLLARGMDLAPGPPSGETRYAPDPAPSTGELVRSAFVDHLRHLGRIPRTVGYTAQGINRVRRSTRKLSPELTMPFTPPPSFMNHMLTPERRFATATLALSDIKETGKALGVTINDMVLALSAGALRKLLLRYDGDADHPLLASVPVSFDFSPDRVSGNFFTGMMVALPPTSTIRWSGCGVLTTTPSTPRKAITCSDRSWSAGGRRTFRRRRRSRCSAGWPVATARTRCSTCRSPTFRVRVNTAGSAAHWSPRSIR